MSQYVNKRNLGFYNSITQVFGSEIGLLYKSRMYGSLLVILRGHFCHVTALIVGVSNPVQP